MRKISALFIVAMLVIVSAACSGSSNPDIVGRWAIVEVDDSAMSSQPIPENIRKRALSTLYPKGAIVEFMDNGLAHAFSSGNSTEYDFPDKGKLRLKNGNGPGVDLMVGLSIKGDRMEWDFGEFVVIFERQ